MTESPNEKRTVFQRTPTPPRSDSNPLSYGNLLNSEKNRLSKTFYVQSSKVEIQANGSERSKDESYLHSQFTTL